MPEPGPGHVRVKVHVCGVCRTDLHVVEAELPPVTRPIIPGHQAVGVVDQLGAGVTTLKLGDRVGIAWLQDTCQTCEFCTTGRENLCESATFSGYHVHGGFAEYALVPARFAYPIPSIFPTRKPRRSCVRELSGIGRYAGVSSSPGNDWACMGLAPPLTSQFRSRGTGAARCTSFRAERSINVSPNN